MAVESKSMEETIGAPDVSTVEVNKNSTEMFEVALGKWANFTRVLEARLKDAGIDYDMRKIGRGAYAQTIDGEGHT